MTAFDEVFREIANREYVMFDLDSRARAPKGSFIFREIYCSRPRCDCQTVTILALNAERQRVVAIIHFAFGADDGSRDPFLDPNGPTDSLANELLAIFNCKLADEGYEDTLRSHYATWRSAVDDRSHPSHALLRDLSPMRGAPRKPRPSRSKPSASVRGVEIAIAQRAKGATSKAQQRFTRLVRKVEGLRARVREWNDQRPAIDRGLALYHAEFATQRDLARQFVEALDNVASDPALPKKHRKKIGMLICSIAKDLIKEDGHHELKAIFDRHAPRSYDSVAAADESAGVASLKEMLEVMGMDLEGTDVRTFDDLEALAQRERAKLEEEEAALARRRAARKKSRKQVERETLAESQQRDASKAMQDIYRKLAVALHPDLERDAAEQARKTTLMQEVNAAYAKKDLLRLLELQLQVEKVDSRDENARDIAEDRLAHFTRILDDQAKQLVSELEDLELPWRVQLDRPPPVPISPNDILAALHRDTEDLRETIAMQRQDLVDLADSKRLQVWLRTNVPAIRNPGERFPF